MARRGILASFGITAIALTAAVGTASAQSDACAGLADCVVAPSAPIVVAVTAIPTTYEVTCPSGLLPAAYAVATQAGVLATILPITNLPIDLVPGAAVTVSAAPTVSVGNIDPVLGGASGATPDVYRWYGEATANGPVTSVEGLALAGSGAVAGSSSAGVIALPTGSRFSASPPPTTPTSATGTNMAEAWFGSSGSFTVPLTNPWNWLTPATMTPTLGCAPLPTPRKAVAHDRITGDRTVRAGTMRHWLRCPAGKTRIGDLEHAVYVTGRSRLTIAERRAIDSQLVKSASGGQHVETRLGANAPDGVRVQLHATCRG